MKKGLKRILSSIVAVVMTTSMLASFNVNAATYNYEKFIDEDALLDTKFTKVENYDAEHGNVYKFDAGKSCDGTTWFTEEFSDGTYIVSMDFKTDNYPSGENQVQILVDSETWEDRVILALRKDGNLGYSLRDAGGVRCAFSYKYGTRYTPGEWNNYSIVYEKNGTEVITTQYVNGTKVRDGVTLYDNFRFKRMTIVTPADTALYLDNIMCYKLSGNCDVTIDGLYVGTEKITAPSAVGASSTIEAKINYQNDSASDKIVTCIIGYYDPKGVLLGADVADEITVTALTTGNQNVEFETFEDMSNVNEVKVFAWENLINLIPLCKDYSVKNN